MKKKILKEHPLLERIAENREKLQGADPEHLNSVDMWEVRVKKALIFLSLDGHEGIVEMKKRAKEEIVKINGLLLLANPADLSPAGSAKYAYEAARMFDKKEMWLWFLSLFTEQQAELDAVAAELDIEGLDDVSNPQDE